MSIRTTDECEIPLGWDALVEYMLTSTFAMYPNVEFTQVKEKFGSLRTHFEAPEDVYHAVSNYVETFEQASRTTCVVCGSVHTTRMSSLKGWISPYCEIHMPKGE